MTLGRFTENTIRFLENREPFFFIVSFDKSEQLALTFDEAFKNDIRFNIKGVSNIPKENDTHKQILGEPIEVEPFSFENYLKGFEKVVQNLKTGNSFLVNLTFPSKIISKIDLKTVFSEAKADYKLRFKDRFVCFSPECFIKVENGYIYTYPMKGTISATIPNAAKLLLENPKEQQEHHTIVDLMRNDLAMVAREVEVTRFRYINKIRSVSGDILQTSSEIRGKLPVNWKAQFPQLLMNMLPAGSISGAPKPKTLEIIAKTENYERGFYTGVFGIFDGKTIESSVAIRYIEKENGEYWYKSGGGITHQSNVKEEYVELINKIYIPTF